MKSQASWHLKRIWYYWFSHCVVSYSMAYNCLHDWLQKAVIWKKKKCVGGLKLLTVFLTTTFSNQSIQQCQLTYSAAKKVLAHHFLLRWWHPCCGRPIWNDICLSVSASMRADMADICHLSIPDLTAPIIISLPPALPAAIFLFIAT